MKTKITQIARNFSIGSISSIESLTTGHINDSFIIRNPEGLPCYFLQRINSYIFKDVSGLMKNIENVSRHLSLKLKDSGGYPDFRVLELIPTLGGTSFYQDPEGEYWRMFNFIDGTYAYENVENESIAFEGGRAFGHFIALLADLPANRLQETIPDFHNMETRLNNFRHSLQADVAGRAKSAEAGIRFVEDRAAEMMKIPSMLKEGLLPMRITHNDTKFNNVLFNSNKKAVCIVDLDTVMPGSLLYDFGDAIRTAANSTCEDEKDLDRVGIRLDIFKAYTEGFLLEMKNTITREELENLAFSARYMTFIIGLRFLTDYLDGDSYFRTAYPDHNLDRTKVQFRLIESMEKNAVAMENIVRDAREHSLL